MTLRRILSIVLFAALTAACSSAQAGPTLAPTTPDLSLRITPRFALSRTDVRMVVRMRRHPANRRLLLILDGPRYNRVDIELEGEDAAEIIERFWLQVREGEYRVRAVLERAGGRTVVAEEALCVAGITTECGGG
jgi:hypothetical protein